MSKKKEQYIPLVGITGEGEDYNIYVLSLTERIIGYLIGVVLGFAAAQIMFGVTVASLVLGLVLGIFTVPIYRDHLQSKRRNVL